MNVKVEFVTNDKSYQKDFREETPLLGGPDSCIIRARYEFPNEIIEAPTINCDLTIHHSIGKIPVKNIQSKYSWPESPKIERGFT